METHYEDTYEPPTWMEYKLVLIANTKKETIRIKNKIREFEKKHPQLVLIHAEYGTEEIKSGDPRVLFQDNENMYHELKYSFIRRFYTYYYQPNTDLHCFLNYLQEFINKMKKIRSKSSNK